MEIASATPSRTAFSPCAAALVCTGTRAAMTSIVPRIAPVEVTPCSNWAANSTLTPGLPAITIQRNVAAAAAMQISRLGSRRPSSLVPNQKARISALTATAWSVPIIPVEMPCALHWIAAKLVSTPWLPMISEAAIIARISLRSAITSRHLPVGPSSTVAICRSDGSSGATAAGSSSSDATSQGSASIPVRPKTQPADAVEMTTAIEPQTRIRPKSSAWLRTAITA